MEAPITVKFRWSADDLLQGYLYCSRQSWRPKFRAAFSATVYCVAALGVIAGAIACVQGNFSLVLLVFPLFGVLWWLRFAVSRCVVRRQFARRPDRDMEIEWRISPDKVLVQSPIARSELNWNAFAKVVCTPSAIMFFPVNQIFHYVPRRGFANEAEFEQIAALAKSKVSDFRYVA
jgi:hypothetical protein